MGTDLVVVSVGTDHHRFDRLVGWMDEWAGEHPQSKVIIQRGGSPNTVHCESHELIPHGELCELFAAASVVISHGGPSTVMDARSAGRFPIVVPRDPARGEHVDDHQLRFGRHLAHHGLAVVATEREPLERAIEAMVELPAQYSVPVELGALPGVLAFARVVDSLVGCTTPMSRRPVVEPIGLLRS